MNLARILRSQADIERSELEEAQLAEKVEARRRVLASMGQAAPFPDLELLHLERTLQFVQKTLRFDRIMLEALKRGESYEAARAFAAASRNQS